MPADFDDGLFHIVLVTEAEALAISRHYDEVEYEGHSSEVAMGSAIFEVLGEDIYEKIESIPTLAFEEVRIPTHIGKSGDMVCKKS